MGLGSDLRGTSCLQFFEAARQFLAQEDIVTQRRPQGRAGLQFAFQNAREVCLQFDHALLPDLLSANANGRIRLRAAREEKQILRFAQDDMLCGWPCPAVPRKTEKVTRSQDDMSF
jgi:hypothetical protein